MMSATVALLLTMAVQAAPAPLSAAEESRRIDRAAQLGSALYDYDRAAWTASDALAAKLPRDRLTGAGGWVVEPGADRTFTVTFYQGSADSARVMFIALVRDGKLVDSRVVDEAVMLTAGQLRLARARDVAATEAGRKNMKPCAPRPFNTVVIAPADPQVPVLVYLLTPQVDDGAWPIGGHYRITVGANGGVVSSRPYSVSCLTMKPSPRSEGKTPAGLFVTHLLDPVPTELHVFTSYTARLPLIVGTRDKRLWSIAGARIEPYGIPGAVKSGP